MPSSDSSGPSLRNCLDLIAKIGEGEIVLDQLALHFLGLLLIDVLFDFFNQAEHVAHAENALGDAVGMERLQRVRLFAHADELQRLAR